VDRAESTTDGDVDRAESTNDTYHSIEGQIFYWHTHRQDQSNITPSKNEVSVCDDTAQVGWAHSLQNLCHLQQRFVPIHSPNVINQILVQREDNCTHESGIRIMFFLF